MDSRAQLELLKIEAADDKATIRKLTYQLEEVKAYAGSLEQEIADIQFKGVTVYE